MTVYCSVEIRAARMYEDPEPAEFCDNEVALGGDVCGFHDEDSRREAEAEDYAEMQRKRRTSNADTADERRDPGRRLAEV